MTKAVRNSARLIITMFGGACCVPIAVRRKDRTTTIRVNDVTITRMDGAILSTVSSATSWMIRDVVDASPPRSMFTLCASAGAAAVTRTAATATILRMLMISATRRSEEHTSELQSLMRISYAV